MKLPRKEVPLPTASTTHLQAARRGYEGAETTEECRHATGVPLYLNPHGYRAAAKFTLESLVRYLLSKAL